MARRDLSALLAREIEVWSDRPYERLVEELRDIAAYETSGEGGPFQVEVQLLEHTETYVHVSVSVDDGGWRAFVPLTGSFLVHRDGRVER